MLARLLRSDPKPVVPVGQRRILWHLMNDYARYGHREFILCLGRGALQIKEFFLNLNECESNDFVLADGGQDVRMVATDNNDWKITFVDTGLTGQSRTVQAPHPCHINDDGYVERLEHIASSPVSVKVGFFAFRRTIFDVTSDGEKLAIEPFERLIAERQLLAYPYDGFWQNMDTFKDRVLLDEIAASPPPPSRVWEQ